jgi:uncharacterized protein (TIGR02145 family)
MPITQSTFTDIRDGHTYKTVEIGKQVWMAENLNYYAEGLRLYKKYEDDSKYGDIYGLLYDWKTATKVCPGGWHLPSDAEWDVLMNYVGGIGTAGIKLKAKSGWNDDEGSSGNGIDEYGFLALPGGCNSNGAFSGVGEFGFWWSSNECTYDLAYFRGLGYSMGYAYLVAANKNSLFSVRCVKN